MIAAPDRDEPSAEFCADVLNYMRGQIAPETWEAISHAHRRRPGDNIAGLRAIDQVVTFHNVRPDPVFAFFGWLHPVSWEQGEDRVYHVAGPSPDWANIYQGGRGHFAALLPTDDAEVVAAMGLCNAARSSRDRRVKVYQWPAPRLP